VTLLPTREPPVLRETPDEPPARIRPRSWDRDDIIEAAGALISSFCLTWLVYEQLTPLSGGLGFFAFWFATFLCMYWILVRRRHGLVAARDRFMSALVTAIALVVVLSLAVIVGYTIARGLGSFRPHFFTTDMRFASPLAPPTVGGGEAALVGTIEQVGLALLISVPAGISIAVLLSEIRGPLGRVVKVFIEAMNGIPSVLAALFILAVWILEFHYPQSGFAIALALSVSMLPTVARTAAVVLDLVPGGLREASLALGGHEWRMVRRVILPTARAGLVTAIILGVARVVGETAPTLIDNSPSNNVNWNPFRGPQDSLPAYVYRYIRTSVHNDIHRAWTGAMVLIILVLVLFALARLASRRRSGDRRRSLRYWRTAA
jgi:phosphate transport system permease protein